MLTGNRQTVSVDYALAKFFPKILVSAHLFKQTPRMLPKQLTPMGQSSTYQEAVRMVLKLRGASIVQKVLTTIVLFIYFYKIFEKLKDRQCNEPNFLSNIQK